VSERLPELLAGRLALAILEHGPLSGSALSIRVAARKDAVLRELRSNPMFECLGRARGSRWSLAGNRVDPSREPQGTDPVPQGTDPGAESTEDLGRRLLALERRIDEFERRLASEVEA
jgi:hypothetical protein